ncbi:MAG: ABC transporter permease subunit [Elusimicrobia bacterium]|nr:ABC transporter permease subunit [Elusimicrobiota bacterium]
MAAALIAAILALFSWAAPGAQAEKPTLTIGSKRFPESYILAEIAAQTAEETGEARVIRKFGLGGTAIVYRALRTDAVDLYPEYTGTILEVILQTDRRLDLKEINQKLAAKGLATGGALGFDNSYALALPETLAAELGIRKISDLKKHADIRLGLSHEFLKRKDGYPGLKKAYRLNMKNITGLDHGLAYEGLAAGTIDATDVYTTDGKLLKFNLRILEDDLLFFPDYSGVFLYRKELEKLLPKTMAALDAMAGKISRQDMIAMNAQAELKGDDFASIASNYLHAIGSAPQKPANAPSAPSRRLAVLIKEHLILTGLSLFLAVLTGVPLGVLAGRRPKLGQITLAAAGIIQTIPSLALLCFMIPIAGIGERPAVIALFLYSLLPIVRNTLTALQSIEPKLTESAAALGLSSLEQLFLIQLPLSSRSILSGIKISAVINIGTATLAALIGAGGLGEPIVTGLALNDTAIILRGAIPAALLALLVHGLFEILDLCLIPKGLRLKQM